MTPNSYRGGRVYSQRGDGANIQPLRSSPLNTHIKRHPSVESCGEAPRSVEQEDSHNVGHVCFIDRLPGLSAIPDPPDITTSVSSTLCKAPRDSSVCWEQFVICLEEIRFVVVIHLRFFNPTPMSDPGRRRNSRPYDGPACERAASVLS